MIRLKFSDEYIDVIDEGGKDATVRYDLEPVVTTTDKLTLLDEDGRRFGEAEIHVTATTTAALAYQMRGEPYRTLGAFLDVLRRHYPDEPDGTFHPGTEVEYIGWRRYEPVESYWSDQRGEFGRIRGGAYL